MRVLEEIGIEFLNLEAAKILEEHGAKLSNRHLDCLYDKLTLSDKVVHAYSLGKERVEDVMEMTRIAGGLSHEEFDATPRMYTNINSTSPLKHDHPMLDGLMRLARRGQPTGIWYARLHAHNADDRANGSLLQDTTKSFQYLCFQCAR